MESSRPKAVIAVPVPAAIAARLAAVCEPKFVDINGVLASISEAEGLLCPAPFPISRELLDLAPRLRVVSNFGVGFNNVDLVEMGRRGIAVCNTPGVLTEAVADLTIAMMLMASRGLVANSQFAGGQSWSSGAQAPDLGWDVQRKTLGLVGFGRIGRAVALRARAFGMNVAFYDTFASPGPGWEYCQPLGLHELLATSDVVSLHVNLTPETVDLIGADQIGLMKPSAWLLNTSRGPVIDQAALVRALQSNAIAGAVLDVLEVEPPPASDPILGLDNAILLPHIGSATVETRAAMLDLAVNNLCAVLNGERPPECVNPEVLERALKRR
ncbi:MAG: D-glycerate dehydrogenase [bacterium]